jgi:hypothetical protein
VVDIATTMQIDETEIESSEDMPFDYGALYDWSKPIIANHQKRIEGKTWVENTVCHDDNENTSEDLNLPKKSNGEYYSLDTLSLDQKQVLAFCLQQIKNQIDNLEDDIETMCLTVRGMAGSGKSTFIKTLVTTIRNFFQRNDSVLVSAPTGMAASEAGGSTCHHLWNIPVDTKNYQLDNQRIEVVRKK